MIIYAHKRVDNGAIFYIGASGNLKRAYSKCSRSKKWKEIGTNIEFEVLILEKNLSIAEAIERECAYIKQYGLIKNGGTLVNKHANKATYFNKVDFISDETTRKKCVKLYFDYYQLDVIKSIADNNGFETADKWAESLVLKEIDKAKKLAKHTGE